MVFTHGMASSVTSKGNSCTVLCLQCYRTSGTQLELGQKWPTSKLMIMARSLYVTSVVIGLITEALLIMFFA